MNVNLSPFLPGALEKGVRELKGGAYLPLGSPSRGDPGGRGKKRVRSSRATCRASSSTIHRSLLSSRATLTWWDSSCRGAQSTDSSTRPSLLERERNSSSTRRVWRRDRETVHRR